MKKRLTIFFCRTGCDSTDSCDGLDHFHRLQVFFTFLFVLFNWSLHSSSTSTRFSLTFNFNDQLNLKYICYVLVKSSPLHQMQASSILHIFNFIHLEPYVKLTIFLCFVNITTVLIYSLQSFWILHIYCILCHPINFHLHITVHISLSLSQFLANSLHPSHSTRTPHQFGSRKRK